jgi:hypothetical protein
MNPSSEEEANSLWTSDLVLECPRYAPFGLLAALISGTNTGTRALGVPLRERVSSRSPGAEAQMSRKQYFVSCEDGEWIIKLGDQYIGGYPSEAAAFRAAVDAAYLEGSRGSDAEVLALTENNIFRTKWTYGHDPYPPT